MVVTASQYYEAYGYTAEEFADEGFIELGELKMIKRWPIKPIYFECVENGHKKFWAASIYEEVRNGVHKYDLVRKWGRMGTKGQQMEQEFDSQHEAETALDKLISEKSRKGYKPVF